MSIFNEQLEREAGKLHLTPEERGLMRASIEAHMLAYPFGRMKSPWSTWVRISQFAVAPMAILLIFAGTAYAAAGSLPGDLLYPVKIHVNEPVEVAFATSPQAQVALQQHLAKERVSEAQALAAAGRLDATTTQELQDNFEVHASVALALAEHVAGHSTTTAASSTPEATTTPEVASTTLPDAVIPAPAVGQPSKRQASTTKSKDNEDDLDVLKASLDAQSNIFKTLRSQIDDAKDQEDSASLSTTTPDESSKGNSHREGEQKHVRNRD